MALHALALVTATDKPGVAVAGGDGVAAPDAAGRRRALADVDRGDLGVLHRNRSDFNQKYGTIRAK